MAGTFLLFREPALNTNGTLADLVCNFIRQRAETDAGQGHAFSVFIKFFRLQLGVAGIPDKEEVFVFHKAQFLGNCLCFQQLIAVLCPSR